MLPALLFAARVDQPLPLSDAGRKSSGGWSSSTLFARFSTSRRAPMAGSSVGGGAGGAGKGCSVADILILNPAAQRSCYRLHMLGSMPCSSADLEGATSPSMVRAPIVNRTDVFFCPKLIACLG